MSIQQTEALNEVVSAALAVCAEAATRGYTPSEERLAEALSKLPGFVTTEHETEKKI